jgi:hypothetical protein
MPHPAMHLPVNLITWRNLHSLSRPGRTRANTLLTKDRILFAPDEFVSHLWQRNFASVKRSPGAMAPSSCDMLLHHFAIFHGLENPSEEGNGKVCQMQSGPS